MTRPIALLHPGEMGAAIGACAHAAGYPVGWVAEGRSDATRNRAHKAELKTFPTLGDLIGNTDIVISICPPSVADRTASEVAKFGFKGIYLDANAISPRSAEAVAGIVEAGGASYVDGGIIGPPPYADGTTRLYLSGARAAETAAYFAGSKLEAIDIGGHRTAASALKMCYAAWTKGSSALLLAVRALARAEGVEDALCEEWHRSQPGLESNSESAASLNAAKAWRFVDEMQEIACTFDDRRLSGDYHRAAAQTYASLAAYKDVSPPPTLDEVLQTMLAARDDAPA
ncbi:MAG: DUF1932 domain-containing protein [Gammaproteobacteria bacterium]|nr:DUF1932 domain-containing protein [Gammaproteobacteria bacterium]